MFSNVVSGEREFSTRLAAIKRVVSTSSEAWQSTRKPVRDSVTVAAIDALYDLFEAFGARYPFSQARDVVHTIAADATVMGMNKTHEG